MTREDLVRLRQRAGNLETRELRDAAAQCGWEYVRTRGGHHAYRKRGHRTLIIPDRVRSGTARGIINALIDSLEG